jgi:hypothetical protein
VAAQLAASQEGFHSMELGSQFGICVFPWKNVHITTYMEGFDNSHTFLVNSVLNFERGIQKF